MPIREFKCEKCGKIIEELFLTNENTDSIICKCGNKANKILSSGIFKINGYSYSNGYSKGEK